MLLKYAIFKVSLQIFFYLNIILSISENFDYVTFQMSNTEPITMFVPLFHLISGLV